MNKLYHRMLRLINHVMYKRYISPWIIAMIDLLLVVISIFISGAIIGLKETWFHFPYDVYSVRFILFTVAITAINVGLFKIHRSIIRYSSFSDMLRIFVALLVTNITLLLINYTYKYFIINGQDDFIPKQLVFVNFFVTYILLFMFRMFIRWLFEKAYHSGLDANFTIKTLIFGAGHTGIATANALMSTNKKYYIKGFLDDDKSLTNKTIMGFKVWGSEKEEYILKYKDIDQLIIATNRVTLERKNRIFDLCHQNNIKVLTVPPVKNWVGGKLQENNIKEIQIEDLLGRKEIKPNQPLIEEVLGGKRILVTGAAGSIGSEIVRQLTKYNPTIILLDQGETPLFYIENELNDNYSQIKKHIIIASINDKEHLEEVFSKYKPQIVFHAAAYKHVPMMEGSPYEAATTNIFGTKNVADLSIKYNVERFIMISTDKAVNPTNVMGATKRYAEMYVESLNENKENKATRFTITRFGNVLGSNGSVIPRFKQQIEKGGPVTVTHKDIMRYFMTIPEASRLVLEAVTMGKGGEIFLFDMGEPVKIKDLAERMIKLSGLEPDKDIKIEYCGLRPGEKLVEELLTKKEDSLPTYHQKIFIAKTEKVNKEEINKKIEELKAILNKASLEEDFLSKQEMEIVENIKQTVKTFKSNNSRFEVLDKKEKNSEEIEK
jgi:FlaA1/EpsC-like NDP-sugar epimerase